MAGQHGPLAGASRSVGLDPFEGGREVPLIGVLEPRDGADAGWNDEPNAAAADLLVSRQAIDDPRRIDSARQALRKAETRQEPLATQPIALGQARPTDGEVHRGLHPQRHRLAVTQFVLEFRLDGVSDRVAEVERRSPDGLRRRLALVFDNHLRLDAAVAGDEFHQDVRVAGDDRVGIGFVPVEEAGIAHDGVLDRFGQGGDGLAPTHSTPERSPRRCC